MPCMRQKPVSATYDSAAPPATNSSWTRTRFPLHDVKSSRICSRYGSAFSARWISGTLMELERSTLRTVSRDNRSTCAISCLLRSEEHTSELQSPCNLVCRLLLEKKKHSKEHRDARSKPHGRHRRAHTELLP